MNKESIHSLPTDQIPPSPQEKQMINTFFPQKGFQSLCYEFKDVIIIGIIYFVVGLPFIDGIIKSIFSSAQNSSLILLGTKSILFMIIYFIIMNWGYSRKK